MAQASVIISEIAWMGTETSANDEWIELYNNGSSSVSLTGWALQAVDGSPDIPLEGSIPAGGYFLLERSDDDTVPGVSADIIFSGGLGNSGETLILKDSAGATQNSVNASAGWPAGDNTTKETMQWNGSQWVTAEGTPKAGLQSSSGNQGSSASDDETDEEGDTASGQGKKDTTIFTQKEEAVNILQPRPQEALDIILDIPHTLVAGNPVAFFGKAQDKDGNDLYRGRYVWSMGDGSYFEKTARVYSDFSFSYTYPSAGDYYVVFEYYPSVFSEDKPVVTQRVPVQVIPSDISIEKVLPRGDIVLKNNTNTLMSLSDWELVVGRAIFSMPPQTFIGSRNSYTLSSRITGFADAINEPVVLKNPSGEIIDRYLPEAYIVPPISSPQSSQGQGQSASFVSSGASVSFSVIATQEFSGEESAPDAEHIILGNQKVVLEKEKQSPPRKTIMFIIAFFSSVIALGAVYGVYVYKK